MNKKTRMIATCLILSGIVSVNGFAADKTQPLRVIDAGTDGDDRFYTVYCPDGKRAALVKHYEIGEVCTQPSYSDKDICKNWSIDEAAQEACK